MLENGPDDLVHQVDVAVGTHRALRGVRVPGLARVLGLDRPRAVDAAQEFNGQGELLLGGEAQSLGGNARHGRGRHLECWNARMLEIDGF
jgi:hypothetical protein